MGDRRRRRRWVIAIGLAVLLLLGTAFAVVRIELDGPRLGAKIASFLNKGRRGRIEIESIEWPTSGLKAAVTGGWVPVQLRGLRVWDDCALADTNADPEELRTRDPNQDCTPDDKPDPDPSSKRKPRKLLLRTDLLTGEIDAHAVLFGNHDIVLRHVVMHGGEALIEQTREPQPLHAYNKTIVSLVTAFYPRLKAGFRAGIYADQAPPIFDLRDIHLEHVNITVHVAPYTKDAANIGFGMAARIEDVNVDADAQPKNDAYLYMDGRDPLVQKFYFRLSATGKHGVVRILDEGPRGSFRIPGEGGLADAWAKGRGAHYQIEISSIELKRLAQLPLNWSHLDKKRGYDYIANNLEVDGTIHTLPCGAAPDLKDGAELHVTGGLDSYWDRPYDGKWDFKLDAQNLGPTVRTCIKSSVGGDHMGGTVAISGPFIALPRVDVDMHDVDLDIPLSKNEEPVKLTLAEARAGIDLVNDYGYVDESKALERGGKGGEVMLSATFGLKPYHATASVDILKPLDIGRFLPARVVRGVGSLLTGKLSVDGDLETGFKIYDFNLGLGPSLNERRVSVFTQQRENGQVFATDYFNHIKLQRIYFQGGQSHATIGGRVDYQDDDWNYNIHIDGQYPDLDRWLKMFGLPAFIQKAGGAQVVITGRGNKPTIKVDAALQGVPCLGTVQGSSTTQGGVTSLRISSGGLGGTLSGDGVINTAGAQPVIEKLHLTGTKLEAAKVCGLNGLASGTIDSAELELKGTIDARRAAIDWAPLAKIYASAQHATVLGDRYSDVAVCINRSDADDAKLCRRSANVVTQVGLLDCTNAKAHGGFCAVARATRDRGGTLDTTIANVPAIRSGRTGSDAHLGGDIKLDDVPMAVLEPLVGPGTVGGLFSAVLHLTGEPLTAQRMAPQASGAINLLRGWVGGAFVGDPQLEIEPTTIDTGNGHSAKGLRISGGALASGLGIVATLGTEPPYAVAVSITGRRIEVDQFMDLGKRLGVSEPVQAWASGTLTLYTELAPKSRLSQPEAWLEVTELEATLDHTSRDGRHVPLRFGFRPGPNGLALSLRVTPATLELACRNPQSPTGMSPCPAQLDTPAGMVSIEGSATPTGMTLKAVAKKETGLLDLRKLAPLLENQLDDISGKVALALDVNGTMTKPDYDAKLTVVDTVKLRPTGSDTELQIAKDSEVELVNGTLGFNSFTVQVKDERREQQGALHVKGTLALDGFKPAVWGVLIEGQIAGKLLQVIAPSAIAQASGIARIEGDLVLRGKGLLPQIDGVINFDPAIANENLTGTESLALAQLRPSPLSFVPRTLRREIALVNGSVQIKTEDTNGHRSYTLSSSDDHLTATIDGEGRLKNVDASFEIRDGTPFHAKIDLDADNVPFRIPQTLDLVFAANDIELEYDNDRWHAHGSTGTAGNIAIVSGKFLRKFDLAEAIKPVPPTIAPPKPFWDEYPSIGNADLDLVLDVRRFSVDDNIAQIDLTGTGIAITGSPRDPRLQGSISVQRGEFKIPLTRAKFTRTTGTIDFAANDRAANPTLSITSEAPDYADLSGQQHVITLTITGTLEQPQWDLKTNTGLDKSQTLALLLLGRNPEQLRRSLGDQSFGGNPTAGDQSTNPSGTFGDQLVKDLAGDWVSGLIGSSLQSITGLDVLRFELGFGSVKAHVEKKFYENIKAISEYETTIRGTTFDANVEVRTPIPLPWKVETNARLSLQGGVLLKQYNDPADQALDVQDFQGKLVYRLFIP